MTTVAMTPLGVDVPYRRTVSPAHSKATFTADDTDNHDYLVKSQGKPVLNVVVDNPANQDISCRVYGAPASSSNIGDSGVVALDDAAWTVAATVRGQEEGYIGWAFPYYIIRLAYAVTPTDDPKKTCTLWINLMAGGL